jgi:hypothetical protein
MPSTEPQDTTRNGSDHGPTGRRDDDGARLRRAATVIVALLCIALAGGVVLSRRDTGGDGGEPNAVPVTAPVTGDASGAPIADAAALNGQSPDGERFLHVNDVLIKADLAEKLPYAPEIIILGGSRSLRFEPRYLKKKTGHTAFNAGVRNGRPEEAWGLIHFLHDLNPDVRPRYLWLIHPKALRGMENVSPALVYDPRFSRYFPGDFIREQEALVKRSTLRPYYSREKPAEFASDGRIVWSKSDEQPLSIGIPNTVKHWNRKNGPGTPTIEPRPREWFERTLAYMNDEMQAKPVIVMMPFQPDVVAQIEDDGFREAYTTTLAYLKSLEGTYGFRLFDFTDITSFGGDPQDFYDGYHPRIENTHRIVNEILRRSPHAFD